MPHDIQYLYLLYVFECQFYYFIAGIFIGTYEAIKNLLAHRTDEKYYPFIHMFGASAAEVVSIISIFRWLIIEFHN